MTAIDYANYGNLYRDAIYRLLPKGEIWPSDIEEHPGWSALIDALAGEFSRIHEDGIRFLESYIPCPEMGYLLLDEWENELGLRSDGLTNPQRVLQILAKLRGNVEGPTLAALQQAAVLVVPGALVEHQKARPAKCGLAYCGDTNSAECGGNKGWLWTVWVTYEGPRNLLLERVLESIAQVPVRFLYTVTSPPEEVLSNQVAEGTLGVMLGISPMVVP